MTRTGWILVTVYGIAFIATVSKGGQLIGAAHYGYAAAVYAIAVLCLIALCREHSRVVPPGDYTDDLEDTAPHEMVGAPYTPYTPGPSVLKRIRAGRAARRELRNIRCGCNRYWTSAGTAHDRWCPQYDRSST